MSDERDAKHKIYWSYSRVFELLAKSDGRDRRVLEMRNTLVHQLDARERKIMKILLETSAVKDALNRKNKGQASSEESQSQRKEEQEDPPLQAQKLLHFLLPAVLRENVIGDLEEEFRTIILPKFGPRAARLWYWFQVVRSLGPVLFDGLKKLVRIGVLLRISDWISKIGS